MSGQARRPKSGARRGSQSAGRSRTGNPGLPTCRPVRLPQVNAATERAGNSARHEDQRLSVEPCELHDGADKASCAEVEGDDVVFSCAVQATARPEPQSARSAGNPTEPSGAKTRTSCPVTGSYSRTLVTASGAPNGHSLATTMFPLGASFRSRGLSSGSVTRRGVRITTALSA